MSNDDNEFNAEYIPAKVPLVLPVNKDTGLNTIAYHAEAPFSIRKLILERAV